MWFPNRSDTNRPVQAQKRARSLKFRIKVGEELYYPSSENKGADQLLCFRICRLLVFPRGGSNTVQIAEDISFIFLCINVNGSTVKLVSPVNF